MLDPGTILLDKYRVERVLGKGGMGLVVSVRHVQLGELFALKTLLPDAVEHPEAMERFLREARACARLKGEHVVRVHDVGNLADGTPYMLMEHLDGEDLSQVLARRQTFPVDEAAFYVHQACEAVAEAHANGIVHRDLKPANLFLIRRPNGTLCVKVLDFGISKELDQANKVGANLTKTGTFMGSPIYMSPEQMADIKTTGPPGDVWALGVILYEFVTGQSPFAAEAVTSVVAKVLLSQPEPPSGLHAGIPSDFDTVVMRCLEKQPAHRYPSVSGLMQALEPFLGAMPSRTANSVESFGSVPRSVIALPVTVANSSVDSIAALPMTLGGTIADAIVLPSVGIETTIRGDDTVGAKTGEISNSLVTLPKMTVLMEAPAVESSSGDENHTISSASAIVTISPVEPEAHAKRDKLALAMNRGGRKMWMGAIALMGVAGVVGLGVMGATKPGEWSMASVSVAASIVQDDGSAPKEIPKPELTTATPISRSSPSNDSATVASTPIQATKTPQKSKVATPAPTSPRVTTKKSRVPGYDD